MSLYVRVVAVFVAACFLPSAVFAQAAITGSVRDTSGAVLPGVTVTASSPALIERVRSVVSDGSGQYRIVDLVAGTYTVTFTLPGFTTFIREGVQLSGSFTATVNAELRVGALEETVTVSGQTPIVDVQSARRQQVLDRDVLTSIPTARVYHSIAALVPGVTMSGTQDVGGLSGPATVTFANHGGRGNEGRLTVDGVGVGAAVNGAGVSYYVADIGNTEEVTFNTSGGLGEAEVGGPVMSVVPRTGGNTVRGSFYSNFANSAMQSDNFTQTLREAGLSAPNEMQKMWEVNGAIGGPVVRDRFWYYVTGRHQGNRKTVAGMFYNANAGIPGAPYVPDLSRQALDDGTWKNASARVTLQATPRNKFNLFWDEQSVRIGYLGGGTATISPEASNTTDAYPSHVQQLTWTSPLGNRVLTEAGFGTYLARWGGRERPTNNRDVIRMTDQASGLTWGSQNWASNWNGAHRWRASLAYVTGAHSMKFGYEGQFLVDERRSFTNDHRLAFRLNNGVPNQLTMSLNPFTTRSRTYMHSFYAQESWTFGRVTLQGGLRYDQAGSYFPEQQVGPELFLPTAITFAREDGVKGYHDLSPRVHVAYDLFGTGRTAAKVNIGRYLEPVSNASRYVATNPISRVVTSTSRSWNDANGSGMPDCDLLNPAAQDLRASGGDFCGAWANQNFGSSIPGTVWDEALLQGWRTRPNDWGLGISIQQEIVPRVSLEVGYHRRWFGNFAVTDNLAVSPSDFDPYSITAPVDPRLPGGGGNVIGDLWDISPAKFGQSDNFVTAASAFGKQIEYWHGVDTNLNARLPNGVRLQGGLSVGRRVTDECDVAPKIDNPSMRHCRVTEPFWPQTQIKGLASYTIPVIDVLVSGTLQSRRGAQLAANLVVPSAVVAQTLGRPLAGNAANVTINLLDPGQMYGDRINQVDLRVAKVFRYGRSRANVGFDLYNALNSSAVQTYFQTFGANWLRPTLIMPARFAKLSLQLDF